MKSSRISHRKSRKGCRNCKQRHIKCDETKPACGKCVAGDLHCSYLDDAVPPNTLSSTTPIRSFVNTPASSISHSTLGSLNSVSTDAPPVQCVLNMAHLELLLHAQNYRGIAEFYQFSKDESDKIWQEMFRYALQHAYLMHELLSISALHLSFLKPSQSQMWKHQATELQTYALTLFNQTSLDSMTDYLPPFLFSSMLGSHMLHDALPSDGEEFGPFIDGFVNYLCIARGVKTQLGGQNWELLRESVFWGVIEAGSRLPESHNASAPELTNLETLLKSADIGPSSLKVYQQALDDLKRSFHAQRVESKATGFSAIFAWPVLVSPEYTNLLSQRRPESLAILAHYAVLLHWHKDMWLFGNGGRRLIECVGKHLGGYWDSWLEWPRSMLEI